MTSSPDKSPDKSPDAADAAPPNMQGLAAFRAHVRERGRVLYRDLPWRRTRDAYAILVSEVMLQQTQVARVDGRWQRWLERFPTIDALASASTADVLEEWQGMGYNRRALALHAAARAVSEQGGCVPSDEAGLRALPGVGPATAAGVRAFAFDLPGVYLETNVRAVFLHELFPGQVGVPDRELIPLVEACCPSPCGPCLPADPEDTPRSWYYALLDYGAHLKRTGENPSRRSAAHTRQSRFEGSRRQKRAELVRLMLAHGQGATTELLHRELSEFELAAGRAPVSPALADELLRDLSREGFCHLSGDVWLT